MSQMGDVTKATAQEMGIRTAMIGETTIDSVLQDLMLNDSEIKRILKGEVQEPLNELRVMINKLKPLSQINDAHARAIEEWLQTIDKKLARYTRLTPYILLLSHIMSLTNYTEEEAAILKLRIAIMVQRDILDIEEEELESADINFFDALKMLCWSRINDSTQGWKGRLITTAVKKIETTYQEQPAPRKKKWGIF